jgi:hypothetical protein
LALTNYKTVFKVDYKPHLGFYDKIFSIAATLPGYPDWFTTGLAVTLQNLDLWSSFTLTHNSFFYIRDLKKEQARGQDEERIKTILATVPARMQRPDYQRLGLRSWYLYPVGMSFDNLVAIVSDKFLAQNKEIKQGICPAPSDVAYTVHFFDNGLKVQLRVGPVKREELEVHFQPDRNANLPVAKRSLPAAELFAEFPEVSLFIDIDVSKNDVKEAGVPNTYGEAQEIHSRLSQNIVKYVLGLKEKG